MHTYHEIFGVLGLAALSIADIRGKKLPGGGILAFFLVGMLFLLFEQPWRDWQIWFRFIPGGISLLISKVSREAIGYGDGLVLGSLAAYGSLAVIGEACLIALTGAGLTALFFLLVMGRGRKTEIPFIPFLFLGYGLAVMG